MLKLNTLRSSKGSTRNVKRLGRGAGSGHGQTAGKGNKGQLQRTGGKVQRGFEGGQMPLYRRVPKRGFNNIFAVRHAVLNVGDLEKIGASEVSLETLKTSGKLKTKLGRLKILGNGELKKSVHVKAHSFSESAKQKIEKAGGRVEVLS
ncbi:MAG: 50S ribosomal protein L15 [Bacteriovoracia bacterium]